ncbi:hypothetical protein SADUNF_Sadunf08G0163400 [Salix dunnii]|uniref:endo-polygalacturonase n=1 Tax=Salix dunnii TaxID=1413687 RepID=A0A835K1U3_9ROSI|nr:hypothetical protein SADUNF_Sadunf08G0163400 [Salix dunnii]
MLMKSTYSKLRLPLLRTVSALTEKLRHPMLSSTTTTTTTSSSSLFLESYLQPYLTNTIYANNRTLDGYIKSGNVTLALKLFDEMSMCDVVTYNLMISGLGKYGIPNQALYYYYEMVSLGIKESPSSFSSVLSICSSQGGLLRQGIQVHCRIIKLGHGSNLFIRTSLVGYYMQMGCFDLGFSLFDEMPDRNLATWNLVLRGFCELGRFHELLRVYHEMKLDGVHPNGLSFCYLIRGCCNERFFYEGKQLHSHIIKVGWAESNIYVANALVDFYSACKSLNDAWKSFESIKLEDVISWNSIVSVHADCDLLFEAVELFYLMQFWGKPSIRSFVALLHLSSMNGNILFGKQIHCSVLKLGFDIGSFHVQSALIDMYGKCRYIESSVSAFEIVPKKTTQICNSLMTSLLHCGIGYDVVEMYGLMVDEGIGLDEVTFSTTLKALSVSEFASMDSCGMVHCCAMKLGFGSDTAVSCSLIDAYSRCGHVQLSKKVFEQLPSPNVICFTSLINGLARNGLGGECLQAFEAMIHKGRRAAKALLELDPEDFSVYLQVSNFYSDIGEYEASMHIRVLAIARELTREFGRSFIEVNNSHIDWSSVRNNLLIVAHRVAGNMACDSIAMLEELENFDGEEVDETEFSKVPSWTSKRGGKVLVNVDSYGAVGDGVSDDTQAFENAWNTACTTPKSVFLVPPGRRYLVNAMRFKGPCSDSLVIQIDGTIVAPDEPKNWDPNLPRLWLDFSKLNGVHFQGKGVIDGSGSKWWASSCKTNKSNVILLNLYRFTPMTVLLFKQKNVTHISPSVLLNSLAEEHQHTDVKIEGLTIQNSQQMHFVISRSDSVRVSDVLVSAPEDSPNTDGIHITGSTNVVLQDCKIGTGDDCVSIVNGSSNIKMKRIFCGPGHGISIGSLGKDNSTSIVTKVVLDTAFLLETTNGLRIKTWQGGHGYVRGVRFENVAMDNVANPIIIDQFYCDSPKTCNNQTSAVEISEIMYRNISEKKDGTVATYCNSAKGFGYGVVHPSADCLSSHNKNYNAIGQSAITKESSVIGQTKISQFSETSTEGIHTEL